MAKLKRLTKLFHDAKRIDFTNSDRLVFFSDVHRGNNSWADEFARNEIIYLYALQYYYKAHFTYVELGDGDELLKFKFVEPIRLAHDNVYRLLQKFHQKKRFHYIFGNHDVEYSNPKLFQIKLNHIFSQNKEKPEILFNNFEVNEALVFKHKESGIELFALHGHQSDDLFHRTIWLNRILLRTFWRPLQLMGLQDPGSVSQNIYKQQKVERNLKGWAAENQQPLICGHTHNAYFPDDDDPPYFNTGSAVHPRWITCIEIEKGAITLVRWRIKPRKKGLLYVKRDELMEPKPLNRLKDGSQDSANLRI